MRVGKGVGVSVGSAVSLGATVGEGGCVSVGSGGGDDGEQEIKREMQKTETRMRGAMDLDMGSILTELRFSPA